MRGVYAWWCVCAVVCMRSGVYALCCGCSWSALTLWLLMAADVSLEDNSSGPYVPELFSDPKKAFDANSE